MPLIDRRRRGIVIRVVYDGPALAGKTTNLTSLAGQIALKRRGQVQSPGTGHGRTAFFDWLDVEGGYFGGKRLLIQLLTVPGQVELLRRRRYIVRTADSIVFVCDSRRSQLDETRTHLEALRQMLPQSEADVPVGLVVQANKQDLDGALAADAVTSALRLAADVMVLPAVATTGQGVLNTFTLGVRMAVDRARALLASGLLEGDAGNPEELHAALLREGREAAQADAALAPILKRLVAPHPAEPEADTVESPPPAEETPGPDVPAGFLWPPVRARGLLAQVEAHPGTRSPRPADWAPKGAAAEIRCGPLILHRIGAAPFSEPEQGRRELLSTVRLQVKLRGLLPPQRGWVLAPRRDGAWQLWCISPDCRSLPDELRGAVEHGNPPHVADLAARAREALALLQSLAHTQGLRIRLRLDQLALLDDEVRYLGPVAEGETPALDVDNHVRKAVVAALPRDEAAREAFLKALSRAGAAP